ncbi:MAG: pilus assembly protein TadG-related protein [Paracoccaceae bacterium]
MVFGVYIWVLIFMVAGIGIDLMRFERDRTALQYTLDRAVLAAADLDQTLTPRSVVEDYFDKAGMAAHLSNVTVQQGLGYRIVSATASTDVKTQFMHMNGVDTLSAPASGTAEESIGGVEVSLVLDVSGSMNSNSRLTNLKIAAKNFVDEMVQNSEDGKLSISIVPYATQVSVPDTIFDQLNASQEHSYSNCINFEATHFNNTEISTSYNYDRTMHFDVWDDFDGRDDDPKRLVRYPTCEDSASREILPLQKNPTTLKNFIDNLWADGNTSLDLGMKWGTALVDPSMQPVVAQLVSDGHVASDFTQRPHGYNDGETLKVIVLMSDGQNTSQYYLNDAYRGGESNIWWNDEQEKYSVYIGEDEWDQDNDGIYNEPMFYWPHADDWKDHAYGEGTYEETEYTWECRSYRRNGSCRRYRQIATTVTVDEPGSAEVLSYADLYAYTSLEWIVEDLYEPWMYDSQAWDDWYYSVRNYVGSSTKDSRTSAICSAAKNKNIVVFTIGFEAPSHGDNVLRDCASSAAHFFDVHGLQIDEAFSSIASSIRKLRLTQ